MLFSSTVFLFCFLPIASVLYLCAVKPLKPYILLAASLFFYAWGEPKYLAVMLIVCSINYVAAIAVSQRSSFLGKKGILALAVFSDICVLGYFKYLNFFLSNFNRWGRADFYLLDIVMPIGISFFVFQSISYVVDVYRGDAEVQKNFAKLVLYISFFPQLIAGPIVKYHDIAADLADNQSCVHDVACGMRRFIIGLGKKVLIANPLGAVADPIFDAGFENADCSIAWLGAIAYSLQLFFDFSGYSDMAIGLGRMFGFHFLENFNYPYISRSITEFWRRWHISLGTWFKEYVYIPLGGNRRGKWRTYINLFFVFCVTGMWHGANWTFILWGMWHGLLIVGERICGIRRNAAGQTSWDILRHIYTILAFIIGWTMFRANDVTDGLGFISVMFGIYQTETAPITVGAYLSGKTVLVLAAAVLFSMPVGKWMAEWPFFRNCFMGQITYDTSLVGVLLLSMASLAASTYNPFIYFRF